MAKILPSLKDLSVRELLKAGAHFGHKVSNTNPRMLSFIHSKKSSVNIIDIKKTLKGIVEACYFLAEASKLGKSILYVGTKRQLKTCLENEAKRAGVCYVAERWLGGLLTNFETIRQNLQKLEKINQLEESGQINNLTKKEKAMMLREKKRLLKNFGGILSMNRPPDVVVVCDPGLEYNAFAEAKAIGATIIGLIDTDTDPTDTDIVIPCNDDSLNVVQYILHYLTDSILYGRNELPVNGESSEKEVVKAEA